jgi:DNA-binding response OmpR family regulator
MDILIIEDNIDIVDLLTRKLESYIEKGNLVWCSGGNKAEKLMKEEWDIILLDHDLPNGETGWRLLNNTDMVRKLHKKKAFIVGISAVYANNKRLIQHGANVKVDKMDADFYNQILSIIESLEASKKIINETKTN